MNSQTFNLTKAYTVANASKLIRRGAVDITFNARHANGDFVCSALSCVLNRFHITDSLQREPVGFLHGIRLLQRESTKLQSEGFTTSARIYFQPTTKETTL